MIEQTKTKPEETLEFQLNKQMETFSFNPPINLSEQGKWLLAVTFFEATNSVLLKTNENNSFSITTPGHWSSRGGAETNIELRELLGLRARNDIELHVEEVRKRGNLIKIGENEYKLSDLDTRKNEIIELIKNIEYNELEHMVFRLGLTYYEIENLLDMSNVNASTTGHNPKK